MEEFVRKHKELLSLEREAEVEETKVAQETLGIKELERRGVRIAKLSVDSVKTGLYGRTLVKFHRSHGKRDSAVPLPPHQISPGDIVGVYSNEGALTCSGVVNKVTEVAVTVAFDEPPDSLEDAGTWNLQKLANDVTYRRLKRGLEDLSRNESHPLVHLLFEASELPPPANSLPPTLLGEGKTLEWYNPGLNAEQREAVEFSLKSTRLAVIHGPPGTGKTTTVIEVILQAVKAGLKVLAAAPSNVAVDNLAERLTPRVRKLVRLGHPARVTKGVQGISLDSMLSRSEDFALVQDVRQEMDALTRKVLKAKDRFQRQKLQRELKTLKKEFNEREKEALKRLLKGVHVVLSTLTTASDDGPLKHVPEGHFDVVVIDECSQALEMACWLALLKAPKVILAGDHLQLPPTIISDKAAKLGLAHTLMERVINKFQEKVYCMLTMQYRMNSLIMDWASTNLYEGRLCAHQSVAEHLLKDLNEVESNPDTEAALVFIDTSNCDLHELELPDEMSRGNEGEADLVLAHLKALIQSGVKAKDIAVIAPYNLQVELIRMRMGEAYPGLEVRTVDGFQGREKEAVILTLVRSNPTHTVGFLAERRRINVAVTRARRHLCVIGDAETISNDPFMKVFIEYLQAHADIRLAWEYEAELQTGTCLRPSYIDGIKAKVPDKKPKQKPPSSKNLSKTEKPLKPEFAPKHPSTEEKNQEEKKKLEDEILKTLTSFKVSSDCAYSFPASLSSYERRLVHEIAEKLDLNHESQGEGLERFIEVRKMILEGGRMEGEHQSPRTEATHEQSVQESNGAESDPQQNEQLDINNETVISGASSDRCCELCGKNIPQQNWDLHTLHCHKHKKAEATNPLSEAKKVGKRKQKKLVKKEELPADDTDLDAVLSAFMQMDSVCNLNGCKRNTSMMGQQCSHCRRWFCFSHHIPEVHGCGDAARAEARRTATKEASSLAKERQSTEAGLKKDKPLDPRQRAYVQKKLNLKLDEYSKKRQPNKKH